MRSQACYVAERVRRVRRRAEWRRKRHGSDSGARRAGYAARAARALAVMQLRYIGTMRYGDAVRYATRAFIFTT